MTPIDSYEVVYFKSVSAGWSVDAPPGSEFRHERSGRWRGGLVPGLRPGPPAVGQSSDLRVIYSAAFQRWLRTLPILCLATVFRAARSLKATRAETPGRRAKRVMHRGRSPAEETSYRESSEGVALRLAEQMRSPIATRLTSHA